MPAQLFMLVLGAVEAALVASPVMCRQTSMPSMPAQPSELASTSVAVSLRAVMPLLLLVVFGAFLHIVNLGHVIHDPEAGAFLSRFTSARVRELQAEHAARWKASQSTAAA